VISVKNNGVGLARGVTISDPLPTNVLGIAWSVDPGDTTAANCAVDVATQTLTCGPQDLASGVEVHVHITSPTTAQNLPACTNATLSNTVQVNTTNDGNPSAGPVDIAVDCLPPIVDNATLTYNGDNFVALPGCAPGGVLDCNSTGGKFHLPPNLNPPPTGHLRPPFATLIANVADAGPNRAALATASVKFTLTNVLGHVIDTRTCPLQEVTPGNDTLWAAACLTKRLPTGEFLVTTQLVNYPSSQINVNMEFSALNVAPTLRRGFATGGGTIAGAQPSSFAFTVKPPRRGVVQGVSLFVVQIDSQHSLVFWNGIPFGPGTESQSCTPCQAHYTGPSTATSYDRISGIATPVGTGSLAGDANDNSTTGVPADKFGFSNTGAAPFTQTLAPITTGNILVKP
jgi:hypothetical protein